MRHLLNPLDLSMDELDNILNLANDIKENPTKYAHKCDGKRLATLFYEPSTRTRLSFESAMLNLGGTVIGFSSAENSSATKGESVADTIRVVSNFADICAIRHPKEGAPMVASQYSRIPVVNAGDGSNEHPTQALLDLFTILEKKGSFEGLKVVILGDISHSRVARSNAFGLTKLGAKVTLAGPSTLVSNSMKSLGVEVETDIPKAIKDADVVMGLRIQFERQKNMPFPSLREYSSLFGVNSEILKYAKDDVLVMHPCPVNRGVELSTEVIDGKNSVITVQVKNGVAVRMAVLKLLTEANSR